MFQQDTAEVIYYSLDVNYDIIDVYRVIFIAS